MTQLRFLPWGEDDPALGAPAGIGPETQAEWEPPLLADGFRNYVSRIWASSLVTSQQLC